MGIRVFEELIGKTMKRVAGNVGDGELRFYCSDGNEYLFYHDQDCCEHVRIEDICGDLRDLECYPIVEAEESSNGPTPRLSDEVESFTWTFYRFSTINGTVTVRWLGTSNGYYSERVNFRVVHPELERGDD